MGTNLTIHFSVIAAVGARLRHSNPGVRLFVAEGEPVLSDLDLRRAPRISAFFEYVISELDRVRLALIGEVSQA
jgi:hypothetical protein